MGVPHDLHHRERADRAIADMLAFTAAESGRSERELHQLFLSAGGMSTDRERQAAALMQVRGQLGLDDTLLRLASDISQADRMEYAKKNWAFRDGSYPIPDVEHLKAAAVLCKSKHGNWRAAEKLMARRARELRVPNALDSDDGDHVAASGYQARRLQRAGLAADDIMLSRSGDGAAAMTYDEPDASEVALAVQDVAMRRPELFDFGKVSRGSVPCSTVALSRHQHSRLYDDDTLALTSTVQSQRDMDAYLLHLAQGQHGAKILGLAQTGTPDRTDDVTDPPGGPSVSDLTQEAVQSAQGDEGEPFAISEKAQDELSSLPADAQDDIHTWSDAAAAALRRGDKYLATDRLRKAANAARAAGAGRLVSELDQHVLSVSNGASTVPDPADAQKQVHGDLDVQAEVDRLSALGRSMPSSATNNNLAKTL